MKVFLATYQLDCGHGIFRAAQDLVFAPHEAQAADSFRVYMKHILPSWQTMKNLTITKQ